MIGTVTMGFGKRISVINITIAAFALVIFSTNTLKAQDYQRTITWQTNPKTFSVLGGKMITQPTFTKAQHSGEFGMLPVYAELIPIPAAGSVSVQIINAVYAPSDHIDNNSVKFIQETIEVKADLAMEKKKPSAYVSFLPFRKNAAGTIEKLQSFTIRLTVRPEGQRRSNRTYAANSVLSSGSWYKVAVAADGIYKIDYNFVKKTMGIDPGSISLNTLAVFGNGGGMVPDQNSVARPDDLLENATLLVDNNGNNRFDADDYLLFYGQMPDAWKFNATTKAFSHEKNLYSDKTYYFITTSSGTGKRVQTVAGPGSANKTVTDFDEHLFHENDQYNLIQSGKRWLGDKMTTYANTQNFSFSFPNLITSVPVTFVSSIAVSSNYSSTTQTTLNGANVISQYDGGIAPGDYPSGALVHNSTVAANITSSQINVAYSFSGSDPSGTAASYIDWFELYPRRSLSMVGDAMTFRNVSSVGAGNVSQFILSNASSSTQVWDVTSVGGIQQMQSSINGSQLSFNAATDDLREFIAFNTGGSFGNPDFVGAVGNQNLHGIGEPTMVIITHGDFTDASNDLASFHRSHDNFTVNVVNIEQCYNEFGSGKPDISAIRDFIKMLYDRAGSDTSKLPQYVLLMGDGSYDPKGRISNSSNYVPTYQSYGPSDDLYSQIRTYTSDDFFALLDDNEGGDITDSHQLLDVAIGRLPVESATEAQDVVNKIKNYKTTAAACTTCVQVASNNSWRNNVTFVADDLDNYGSVFEPATEGLAESTRAAQPTYNYDKIYLDAYTQLSTPAGNRYPDVNTAILNKINTGTLIINWVGHGGESNWAHERIFNMADITQLTNQYLPLFITATCDFSRFDLPDRTAGEWLIVNGKGGGIGSITTVRLVYEDANQQLNDAVFNYMFAPYRGRYPTMGEIMVRTKAALVGSDANNERKFTLLGDPALQLDYPRYNIATTTVNNKPIAMAHDTLKALTQVTIKGEVRDDNNNKLTSFNGTIYPLVFDKISTLKTLGNDDPHTIDAFKLYKNVLFKGKASVTNGDFSFSFIVPKDINYQYGNGRISYYADNGSSLDAHGYTDSIIIGGSSDSFRVDNTGPKINTYMNDEKFVYGGNTNESPMLLMKLQDESGINTVGNGIGHDLTAIMDDNTQGKIILNDYYESELDNFKKGQVKYPFSKLADGRHTLKVKAWDIYNNSSEDYTEFIVTNNAKLALNHVFNYPNPFTTHTQFMFEHNKPCDDLNVSVQIYTISGKLVKSIVQLVHSVGYRVDDIEWDGLDDYGDPIGKGVYVYKVSVRDSNGDSAHKFEKLVVLR